MDLASSREPSIKEFIKYLHKRLGAISINLHESKQEYQQILSNLNRVETHNQLATNDITNKFLDEAERLEREFKSLLYGEKSEFNFLKQQVSALNQEKLKVQQNCLILGTRIEEVERNIGIQLALPSIEKSQHGN